MEQLIKTKQSWNLFFLALPFMILLVLFRYIPLFGWSLSLYEYRAGTPIFQNEFVGLKYFRLLFTSRDFYRVMNLRRASPAVSLMFMLYFIKETAQVACLHVFFRTRQCFALDS